MVHLDEHSIDRYVLNADSLDRARREYVEAHLQSCAECRGLAEFLRSLYADFQVLQEENTAAITLILDRVYPLPRTIELRPFRPHPQAPGLHDGHFCVLAAMSPHVNSGGPETVATFASEKDKTLVRIRQDRTTNTFKLYFHADNARKQQGTIISFPALEANLVLDDKGQVEFRLPKPPAEWWTLHAVARLPVATVDVVSASMPMNGSQHIERQLVAGQFTIRVSYANGELMLDVLKGASAEHVTLAVLKLLSGDVYLISLQDGKGKIQLPAFPAGFAVRLYV